MIALCAKKWERFLIKNLTKRKADNSCPQTKKRTQSVHLKSPSFVYRQDGYELSYEITVIVYHTCQVR